MLGFNYFLEIFVESFSDKGILDIIKVGYFLVFFGKDNEIECG